MDLSKRFSAANLQKNGVLKCIYAAKSNRERRDAGNRFGRGVREFFQPGGADLIRAPGLVDDESELLKHDVQEMIGMNASSQQP